MSIGLDSTTTPSSSTVFGTIYSYVAAYPLALTANFTANVGIGLHGLTWLEKSIATGTTTWYGTPATNNSLSGMIGTCKG